MKEIDGYEYDEREESEPEWLLYDRYTMIAWINGLEFEFLFLYKKE